MKSTTSPEPFIINVGIPVRDSTEDYKYAFLSKHLFGDQSYEIETVVDNLDVLPFDNGGFLFVYFGDSWNTKTSGFIYNNPLWIRQFRQALSELLKIKLTSRDVDYSEQGMQGLDYVHMEISQRVVNALKAVTLPP